MPEFNTGDMGGTMRLGARVTTLVPYPDGRRSLAQDLYGNAQGVSERHRHRYEVNPALVPRFESEAGFYFTGKDADGKGQRMEIAEIDRAKHPFFFGVQYHPEFQSYPHSPSPPFYGLVLAAAKALEELPLPPDVERGVFENGTPGVSDPALSRSPFPSPFGRVAASGAASSLSLGPSASGNPTSPLVKGSAASSSGGGGVKRPAPGSEDA